MNDLDLKELLCLPFYAEKMKEEGIDEKFLEKLKIVKHFYIPTSLELDKISDFIKDCKTCADIGSGYGLLITEIAKKNRKINCLDTLYWEGNKFPIPKNRKNLEFEFNGIQAMAYSDKRGREIRKFDCVICCWMPPSDDWREMLSILSNKKIILVLSKDFNTGTIETYCGMNKFGFKLITVWNSSDKKSIIQLYEKK